jgi:quercetin dioxygenase-like cupin family protein
MKSTICFGPRYDVERLRADLKTAEQQGQAHLHWSTKEHDGGWSAIPLMSVEGKVDPESLRLGAGRYDKTPILKHCPYFEEIIDSFQCPKHRVRLMRLEPGTNIHEHTDPGDSWALGQVRIHIPIVTHDEVYFYVDGERIMMKPGEMWYCDFSRPHRVANKSPIGRVHLVLDLTVNPWLRQMFPAESLAERLGNWRYWVKFYGRETVYRLGRASGLGKVRRWLRGRVTPGQLAPKG